MSQQEHIIINGKYYPMWEQFVQKKEDWIGGTLLDRNADWTDAYPTTITDIRLTPNGVDSAYFEVIGKDYSAGFDVHYGGVVGDGDNKLVESIKFRGYAGMGFEISKRRPNGQTVEETLGKEVGGEHTKGEHTAEDSKI